VQQINNNPTNTPHDDWAELALISSMLFDHEALVTGVESVMSDDFYRVGYGLVFDAMSKIYVKGDVVDLVTLADKLKSDGNFEKIGGNQTLSDIATAVSTSANIRQYVTIVTNKSKRRKMIALGDELSKIGRDEGVDINHLEHMLEKGKSDLATGGVVKDKIADALLWCNEYTKKLGEEKPGLLTGLSWVDKITGGFKKSTVALVGAYPSVGKTALALNVASKQEGSVVIFSLEMSRSMIFDRLVSMTGNIDYGIFNNLTAIRNNTSQIREIAELLDRKSIYVFDDVYSIEEQMSIASTIKPSLVIVDYIQKVRTSKRTDGRRDEVEHISGEYKRMAKKAECVVMLLSQINRSGREKPDMGSLKESGALEADGDYVMLLHRPYVLKKDDPEIYPHQAYLLLDKNKFGATGAVNLHFDGRFQKFDQVEHRSQGEVMPF